MTLSEERHFGRAAARLLLTQPALTRRIQSLEAEVGIKLVERSTREVMLTPAGERFVARARDGVDRLKSAVAEVKAEAAGLRGFLKIGYNRIALHGPFIQLVRAYRQRFPDVQVDLVFMASHEQVGEVTAGSLDLGFMVGRMDSELGEMVLDEEPLVAVLPQGHRLIGRSLRVSELADEAFVLGDRDIWRTYRPIVDQVCIKAGFIPRVVQEAGTSEALLGLVSAGAGVTLYLRGHGPWPGVEYVDLSDCDVAIATTLIWRRRQVSPSVTRFLEMARAAAA
jgi:DNA-binding transcriptional LysR family regulator